MPAAFNLRQYSKSKRPMAISMAMDRSSSQSRLILDTVKDQERRKKQAEGIARWQQIEEDERGLQAEMKRLRQVQREKQRARELVQQQKLEAMSLAESNAKYRATMAEYHRKAQEIEEQEINKREERERKRVEAEEAERRRRAPWTCEQCSGTGKCQGCNGAGLFPAIYFTSNVSDTSLLTYGRKPQGCKTCGGFAPGVTGKMVQGSGVCTKCGGPGLIWPVLVEKTRASRLRDIEMDDGLTDGGCSPPASPTAATSEPAGEATPDAATSTSKAE